VATESIAREAALATIDTEVTAKTLGTTTAEDIVVPKGKPWITSVSVLHTSDGAAAGTSIGVLILRGSGVERQQEIPCGGFGAELTTTHSTIAQAVEIPTNIKCVPGNTITTRFNYVGEDTGTSQAFAELVFSSSPRPGFGRMQYEALELQVAAADTWAQMQGLGTAAADTFLVPTDARRIKQVLTVSVADGQALGAGTAGFRLSGNGVQTEQYFIGSGSGGTHTAEANGHSPVLVKERDIAVHGGNRIKPEAIMIGVDIGTMADCLCLGFEY
jgi:hypothetical protein